MKRNPKSPKKRRRPPNNAGPLARVGILAGFHTAVERAEAVACSRSHLLHCERGAMLPSYDLLARMATTYRKSYKAVELAAHECVVLLERREP